MNGTDGGTNQPFLPVSGFGCVTKMEEKRVNEKPRGKDMRL